MVEISWMIMGAQERHYYLLAHLTPTMMLKDIPLKYDLASDETLDIILSYSQNYQRFHLMFVGSGGS